VALEQRDSFDNVAELYAAARPGYPAALFDDLAVLGGLTRRCRVLEVGCGAGQATLDLAARAGSVIALDPGARLIEHARRRVAGAGVGASLSYVVSSFETYDPPPASFDLVASAQAWHWIPPEIAFAKAAAALTPDGSLAVFGHVPGSPGEPLLSAFKRIFDAHVPGVWGQPPSEAGYRPDGPLAALFAASGRFSPAVHRAYAWTRTLDGPGFAAYLRTISTYHFLPEAPRFALFDALASAVSEHGGTVDLPIDTHLYVAARSEGSP
jgi:SAM-dependent methyltransferase